MKKIISLSLSIMMLISFLIPNSAVFATDGKDITEKVTINDPQIVLLNSAGVELRSLLDAEGRLVNNPTKLNNNEKITISYTWNVADTEGINSGDYFEVQLPGVSLLKAVASSGDKIPVTNETGALGYFTVDVAKSILRVVLNEKAVESPEINNGKLKITLTAQKNLVIETNPANSKVTIDNLVVKEGEKTNNKMGGNPYVHGSNFSKSGSNRGSGGIDWALTFNRKDQINYLNNRSFEEKKNVWLEDRLASTEMTVIENGIRLYPTAYVATEDGKLSDSAFYGPPKVINVRALEETVADYKTFKEKVEALTDIEPFTAFVYRANPAVAGDTDGVLIYIGDLTVDGAARYDQILSSYKSDFLKYLNIALDDGNISQTQYDKTIELYFEDPVTKQEMKKVIGGYFILPTKQPYGGRFNNSADMRYDGGEIKGKPTSALDLSASGEADGVVLTSVTVKKTWNATVDKQVPVTIRLLKDGVPFKQVKLGVENPKPSTENEIEVSGWDYTFTRLKVQNQQPKYTVEEVEMQNYTSELTSEGNVHTFRNTYNAPKTVTFKVRKDWVGPATGDVTVSLYGKDKNAPLQTRTLSAGTLIASFDEVPEFEGTEKIDYSVEETTIPVNAEKVGDTTFESATNTFVVKNKNTEKVDASITKKWLGDGKDELTIYLTINGKRSDDDSHKLFLAPNADAAFNWKATITNLPKYDDNGKLITYSFEEELPAGYTQKPIEKTDNNVVITNVNDATFNLPVEKKWIGPKQGAVEIQLLADNAPVAGKILTLNDGNNWTDTFTGLRVFDANTGKTIKYTVNETNRPANHEVLLTYKNGKDFKDGYIVTNKNIEKLEIPVEKKWVGPEGSEVVIQLVADNVVVAGQELTLNAGNKWTDKFTDLFVYDQTSGEKIVYTVQEKLVPANHKVEVTAVDANDVKKGFLVKNTNISKLNVNVEKKWVNSSVASVKVNLLADGKVEQTVELNQANGWKHTFNDLFQYHQETGKEIEYKVTEEEVPNFSTDIKGDRDNGFVVTNTYLPPLPPYVPETNVPDEPSTPETKDEPKTPEQPTTPPSDNVPENPVPQGDPNKPNVPTTPETPRVPSVPETTLPENPVPQGKTELPKTDGVPAGAMHLFGLAISAIGLLLKKKK